MDPEMARYFASNGFNPDSLGGAAPVDRGMLAQAVMAQQGMPPPRQGPMGGAPPQGGYALGTFQGGPDPNAPGSMAGQPYAPGLFNSSEDRGSYDPVGYSSQPDSTLGRANNALADFLGYGAALNSMSSTDRAQTAPGWGTGALLNDIDRTGKGDRNFGMPTDAPVAPVDTIVAAPPAALPSTALPSTALPSTAPPPGNPPPGGYPVGTFQGGPDPNAPGSTVGQPGEGGIDFGAPGGFPGGYGGFGAFGGFSPGMGSGGWGGGFEGSGFNSGGSYSGGYDTAAGDVGR